jgi:hypothetical protein
MIDPPCLAPKGRTNVSKLCKSVVSKHNELISAKEVRRRISTQESDVSRRHIIALSRCSK